MLWFIHCKRECAKDEKMEADVTQWHKRRAISPETEKLETESHETGGTTGSKIIVLSKIVTPKAP